MKKIAAMFVLIALVCSPSWADGAGNQAKTKISKDLNTADPRAQVDVIVQYTVRPTDAHFNRAHALGAADNKRYSNLNHAAFTMPASAIEALVTDPDVQFVSPDRTVKSHLNLEAPSVNANLVWKLGYSGKGIGVAVIDSGVMLNDQDLSAGQGTAFPFTVKKGITPPLGAFPAGNNSSRLIYAEDMTQPLTSEYRYAAKDDYGMARMWPASLAGMAVNPRETTTFKPFRA